MSKREEKILHAVDVYIEKIESERYNSNDPIITITKNDSHDEVIVNLLTSIRTGAKLQLHEDLINPAENEAERLFRGGASATNSWQFKKGSDRLSESAMLSRNPHTQQRINLYKQLNKLLSSFISTTPDKIVRIRGQFIQEIIQSIPKYDKFSVAEKNHYLNKINDFYKLAQQIQEGDLKLRTQQLLVRCSISLLNKEYLAAYIWLYKIYQLNKENFDSIAENDEILEIALKTLQLYLEIETELMNKVEDSPQIASAYDLQMIFIDHLTSIYDIEFFEDTIKNFNFPVYRD